jgi:hypothetical protein
MSSRPWVHIRLDRLRSLIQIKEAMRMGTYNLRISLGRCVRRASCARVSIDSGTGGNWVPRPYAHPDDGVRMVMSELGLAAYEIWHTAADQRAIKSLDRWRNAM